MLHFQVANLTSRRSIAVDYQANQAFNKLSTNQRIDIAFNIYFMIRNKMQDNCPSIATK